MATIKTATSRLWRIPGLGTLIEISSDYVSEGSPSHFGKIPPIRFWLRALGWPVFLSAFLALLTLPCDCVKFAVKIDARAYDAAFAIIPSMLGFGIGAYALVFGLGSDILRSIQRAHLSLAANGEIDSSSVLHINSMFALPLLVMSITLLMSTIQKIFPGPIILSTATWFCTFLSIALSYQLVKSLFRLGRVIILEKLE